MAGRAAGWDARRRRGRRLGRLAVLAEPASDEAVPSTRRRLQHAAIRAECLADGGYVDVKRVVPDDGARPDTLHQIIFGDELASRPRQDFDDLERAAAERNRRAARPKLTPAEIDFPWPAREDQILVNSGILEAKAPVLWQSPNVVQKYMTSAWIWRQLTILQVA